LFNLNKTTSKFLKLIIVSIIGFFLFAILHNLVSVVASRLFNKEIEEPLFFILATLVCPMGLIVGIIGTIIHLIKK
jgi:hypothetical protein